MRRYLTLRQVAERLGKTPAWMYRHVKGLIKHHRFPARDDAMGGWDSDAITAWQNARLAPELRAALGVEMVLPGAAVAIGAGAADAIAARDEADASLVDLAAELDRRAEDLFNAA